MADTKFERLLSTVAVACALAVLPVGWVGCADAPDVTSELGPDVLAPTRGRLERDVAWLADDERLGRRAGTEGERMAGEWIARRFAELGLEPAGEDDSFFQSFEVPLPASDRGGSSLAWGPRGATSLRGADAIVPAYCSGAGNVEGEVVFCGYGVRDDELPWDDFGAGVRGKVALIVRGEPRFDAPGGGSWGGAGSLFTKVMNAKHRGAVGVVIAEHPDVSDRGLPAFDAGRTARAGLPAVVVTRDGADRMLDGKYADLVRAHDERARPAGGVGTDVQARLVADVFRGTGTARNVLARARGTDVERRSRVVLVGAHYDHLGEGDVGSRAPARRGEIHNGADDNASGTAVTLELARRLSVRPASCDVVLALWSGEELGLLGSDWFCENPTLPLRSIAVNLNLDMVGRADDRAVTVLGAGSAAAFPGWLDELGPAVGLELAVQASARGIGGSDHQSFIAREVPVLGFFSGTHPEYHTPDDDPPLFESGGAARVAELCEHIARRVGGATGPDLAFVELPDEAPEGRRDAPRGSWNVRFGTVPDYAFEGPGLRLTGTSPDSPAEKAGLFAGDVLTRVGEVEIGDIYDFMYALQTYKPGDVVRVRFLRGGSEEFTTVTLEAREVE